MQQTIPPTLDSQALADTVVTSSPGKATSAPATKVRNNSPRAHQPGIKRSPPSGACDNQLGTPCNESVCTVDPIDLHVLYRETVREADRFEAMVREGLAIEFAHCFSTYVLNARIPHLLMRYPEQGTLKVDGAFLDWKIRELKAAVQTQFVTGESPGVPESELAKINHKLNLIAGELARLTFLYAPT